MDMADFKYLFYGKRIEYDFFYNSVGIFGFMTCRIMKWKQSCYSYLCQSQIRMGKDDSSLC